MIASLTSTAAASNPGDIVNAQSTVEVCETFSSIQGESTYAGLTCFFIRLTGCNLSCSYCDTPQSRIEGTDVTIASIVEECVSSGCSITEITGGEPLLQPAFPALAAALRDATGRPVLVETNGSGDISVIPDGIIAIVDMKTPGSGMCDAMDMNNIGRLRKQDELKFVITNHDDYLWARNMTMQHELAKRCSCVNFSPACDNLNAGNLAGWITADKLPVRLNLQLHKMLGLR